MINSSPIVAIDFETEYDADYSVTTMGAINYAMDPRFCAYCVSFACDDGRTWSGKPADAPWEWMHGATVLAWNVLFEQACCLRLTVDGVMPKSIKPAAWHDAQDLCAYICLSHRRSLAANSKAGLGVEMSKDPRTKAKGVKAEEFWADAVLWKEICDYCLLDSKITLLLWLKYQHHWPEIERDIARITRQGTITGIFLDMPALESARGILQDKIDGCKESMPWYPENKPMSVNAFRDTCTEFGLVLPKSTAKDDPDFQAFVAENKIMFPWVTAIADIRRANRTEKVLATMQDFSRNSVMHVGLKYCGAHTGRWSGDDMNLQNLNKEPVFGINLRNVLHARPGHQFIILDYRQIEPRTEFWLVGDEAFLSLIRTGMSPYEAYARANMGWTGGDLKSEDSIKYGLAKACVIGLGYGMGHERLHAEMESGKYGRELVGMYTLAEVKVIVKDYRIVNSSIKDLWESSMASLKRRVGDTEVEVPLLSGRSLRYYHPRIIPKLAPWGEMQDALHISYHRDNRKLISVHGGSLVENYVQALDRDIMGHRVVAIEEEYRYLPLFTSHDEVIYEAPDDEAQDTYDRVKEMLETAPPWAEGLPLEVEGCISPFYTKD